MLKARVPTHREFCKQKEKQIKEKQQRLRKNIKRYFVICEFHLSKAVFKILLEGPNQILRKM